MTATMSPRLAGLLCLLLGAFPAHCDTELYKKLGDDVVLGADTPPASGPISSVLWKAGPDMAAEWDGTDLEFYRQYQGRGSLNISSGELTITGLALEDSNTYTVEVNNVVAGRTRLMVLYHVPTPVVIAKYPVPTPVVSAKCEEETSSCVLTCEGNTTHAQPVTYVWGADNTVMDDPSKMRRITKEDTGDVKQFACELQNPVSQENSMPFPNPLFTPSESTPEEGVKISTGLTVFLCLLAVVLLTVFIHRGKAGMWFFQKDSMPWTADFWSKEETPRRDDSNGTAAQPMRGQTDEETPTA